MSRAMDDDALYETLSAIREDIARLQVTLDVRMTSCEEVRRRVSSLERTKAWALGAVAVIAAVSSLAVRFLV